VRRLSEPLRLSGVFSLFLAVFCCGCPDTTRSNLVAAIATAESQGKETDKACAGESKSIQAQKKKLEHEHQNLKILLAALQIQNKTNSQAKERLTRRVAAFKKQVQTKEERARTLKESIAAAREELVTTRKLRQESLLASCERLKSIETWRETIDGHYASLKAEETQFNEYKQKATRAYRANLIEDFERNQEFALELKRNLLGTAKKVDEWLANSGVKLEADISRLKWVNKNDRGSVLKLVRDTTAGHRKTWNETLSPDLEILEKQKWLHMRMR
jgi:chromosome segregation ATPase